MASKWLTAFRNVEQAPASLSDPCADSANSASSPALELSECPIGTTGTKGTAKQSTKEVEPVPSGAAPDEIDERAAIVEYDGGIPRRWAEGFSALGAMAPPSGFSPERWGRILDAAGAFLDRWASEAIRCGWSDLDVGRCCTRPGSARSLR